MQTDGQRILMNNWKQQPETTTGSVTVYQLAELRLAALYDGNQRLCP